MWNQIKNNDDIAKFMGKLAYFHDSCLKELKYVSGAYIEEHYMQPINKKRTLNIISSVYGKPFLCRFAGRVLACI